MGSIGPNAVAESIPVTAPRHGLMATVPEGPAMIEGRWEMGFSFAPYLCAEGGMWVPCATQVDLTAGLNPVGSGSGEQVKPKGAAGDFVSFVPYVLWAERTCDPKTFQVIDYAAQARERLAVTQSRQMEFEFWTGETMAQATDSAGVPVNNPSLAASTGAAAVLNTGGAAAPVAVSPRSALLMLTQALSDCGPGSSGVLHATSYLAEMWAQEWWAIDDAEGKLRTRGRGDLVVSGAGYPGTGPTVVTQAQGDTEVWAYATGMVNWRVGDIEDVPPREMIGQALDRRVNEVTFRAERFGAAVWDTCCTFGVLVDLSLGTC